MNTRLFLWILCTQAACTLSPNTPIDVTDLRWISHQNAQGERILPIARSAGVARSQAWQQWLQKYQNAWQRTHGQTITGKTHWCAQWQQNEQSQHLCRRNQTLVHFQRGILTDAQALREAEKIWIGRTPQ